MKSATATSEEGLASLLEAEGGCVSVAKACELLRKPDPVTRQALTEQIFAGEIIAYKRGDGKYLVPVWQFQPEGGLLPGLRLVLQKIREIPGADPLSPFAFFLQAHPVTGGKRPIDALRSDQIENVLEAVAANTG
jgi:hypothetical protein